MQHALERAREVCALGAGAVDAAHVPAARMTGLARYELTSKAPTLRRLEVIRQTATLLATVRHLETATVDDALDPRDLRKSLGAVRRCQRTPARMPPCPYRFAHAAHLPLPARAGAGRTRLTRLLAERGDLDELRARADAGDQHAVGQLAWLLARHGDLDEAEQLLRACAEPRPPERPAAS
jgi:hypothetical protein